MKNQPIEKLLESFPPELRQEVEDYAYFIRDRYFHKIQNDKFKFEWDGALAAFERENSALEIQVKGCKWVEDADVSS